VERTCSAGDSSRRGAAIRAGALARALARLTRAAGAIIDPSNQGESFGKAGARMSDCTQAGH